MTEGERIAYVRGLYEGLELGRQDGLIEGQRMQAQRPAPRKSKAVQRVGVSYHASVPYAKLRQLVALEQALPGIGDRVFGLANERALQE